MIRKGKPMFIKLFPPFDMDHHKIEVQLNEPMSLQVLLEKLKLTEAWLEPYVPSQMSDETLRNRLLVFINGKEGKIEDIVRNTDHIELLSPISGG